MSRLYWMLALGCGGDPHAGFVTPTGTFDAGMGWAPEGPLDNLVLNPNFAVPVFVNGVGFTWFGSDVVHDTETPTGQPALEGYGETSLLFRHLRRPLTAEVWVSGDPADASPAEVAVVFTDVDTLEDRQVDLIPVEERILGERRWTRYAGDVPPGDGHSLLGVSPQGEEVPRISGAVVRPKDDDQGFRSGLVPSRPADERWRTLYPAYRPEAFVDDLPSARHARAILQR